MLNAYTIITTPV